MLGDVHRNLDFWEGWQRDIEEKVRGDGLSESTIVRLLSLFYSNVKVGNGVGRRKIWVITLARNPGQCAYLIGICQLSKASFQIMEVFFPLQNKPGKTKRL